MSEKEKPGTCPHCGKALDAPQVSPAVARFLATRLPSGVTLR